jgi:hypothetical protein
MDRPRGYHVPEAASWFPIVSGVQAAADLIHQLPPDGWVDADTERLEQLLYDGAAHESEP